VGVGLFGGLPGTASVVRTQLLREMARDSCLRKRGLARLPRRLGIATIVAAPEDAGEVETKQELAGELVVTGGGDVMLGGRADVAQAALQGLATKIELASPARNAKSSAWSAWMTACIPASRSRPCCSWPRRPRGAAKTLNRGCYSARGTRAPCSAVSLARARLVSRIAWEPHARCPDNSAPHQIWRV
jgi:hypothetical protein